MPKRANVKRFDSPNVQGEDSHVTFRRITWGEAKALRKEAKTVKGEGDEFEVMTLTLDVMARIIVEHLLEWNWVMDDDTPMPLPKSVGDLDIVNDTEMAFLSGCINDLVGVAAEESKN